MEMTIPKMKSLLTTSAVEVLTTTDMPLLTTSNLVHPMKNSRHGVHTDSSVSLGLEYRILAITSSNNKKC